MLFNSFEFIFFYLPVVAIAFYALARINIVVAAGWLAVASVFFYAWWDWRNLVVLLVSIGFNFAISRQIKYWLDSGRPQLGSMTTGLAIAVNLIALGYYKYFHFFVSELNAGFETSWPAPEIVLPLGISFFTFTQIAYLVDVRQGKVSPGSIAVSCSPCSTPTSALR